MLLPKGTLLYISAWDPASCIQKSGPPTQVIVQLEDAADLALLLDGSETRNSSWPRWRAVALLPMPQGRRHPACSEGADPLRDGEDVFVGMLHLSARVGGVAGFAEAHAMFLACSWPTLQLLGSTFNFAQIVPRQRLTPSCLAQCLRPLRPVAVHHSTLRGPAQLFSKGPGLRSPWRFRTWTPTGDFWRVQFRLRAHELRGPRVRFPAASSRRLACLKLP